jgi:hypothetical protein
MNGYPFGNGKHTTYKNGDDWGMGDGIAFTHILDSLDMCFKYWFYYIVQNWIVSTFRPYCM